MDASIDGFASLAGLGAVVLGCLLVTPGCGKAGCDKSGTGGTGSAAPAAEPPPPAPEHTTVRR